MWSDEYADHEKTDDWRDAEAREKRNDQPGRAENDECVAERLVIEVEGHA